VPLRHGNHATGYTDHINARQIELGLGGHTLSSCSHTGTQVANQVEGNKIIKVLIFSYLATLNENIADFRFVIRHFGVKN
jgi:hypothetical protein